MDARTVIIGVVGPTVTVVFVVILLALLQHQGRQRAFSIFRTLGAATWSVAILVVFAAAMFSGAPMGGLITPYNIPADWTLVLTWAQPRSRSAS